MLQYKIPWPLSQTAPRIEHNDYTNPLPQLNTQILFAQGDTSNPNTRLDQAWLFPEFSKGMDKFCFEDTPYWYMALVKQIEYPFYASIVESACDLQKDLSFSKHYAFDAFHKKDGPYIPCR